MSTKSKINISIDSDLLNCIDDFSRKNGLTRSGFFSFVARDYLKSQNFVDLSVDMSNYIKSVSLHNPESVSPEALALADALSKYFDSESKK